jgi:hypothetical protein
VNIPGHRKWLEPPDRVEPETIGYCDHCTDHIYEEEIYLETEDGEMVHGYCFEEFAEKKLGAQRRIA